VKHSLASIGKLRAAGFAPGGNFNAGLQATVEFFKKPQPGILDIKAESGNLASGSEGPLARREN
jgi:hypothetical protein